MATAMGGFFIYTKKTRPAPSPFDSLRSLRGARKDAKEDESHDCFNPEKKDFLGVFASWRWILVFVIYPCGLGRIVPAEDREAVRAGQDRRGRGIHPQTIGGESQPDVPSARTAGPG